MPNDPRATPRGFAIRRPTKSTAFRYRFPELLKGARGYVPLVLTDVMISMVQVLEKGDVEELHLHTAMDGVWFVLAGRARFYGTDNEVVAEVGKHEGVFVPRNAPYAFESIGDEPLEIFQVEAIDKTVQNRFIRFAPLKDVRSMVFSQDGEVIDEATVQAPADEIRL